MTKKNSRSSTTLGEPRVVINNRLNQLNREEEPTLSTNERVTIILQKLEEQTQNIDIKGYYPLDILKKLGDLGAYQVSNYQTNKKNLISLLDFQTQIAEVCLNTAFCVWCQTACAWYLLHTPNQNLREEMLTKVESAQIMAGTGLSNPMKAAAQIEDIRLKAIPVAGGYLVNGYLPWVSNLSEGGYFGAVFALSNGRLLTGLIHCNGKEITLNKNQKFIALNGSATVGVRLKDYFLPSSKILAEEGEIFLDQIRPGFILLQAAMGIGNATAVLNEINKYIVRKQVKKNLPRIFEDQYEDLSLQLEVFKRNASILAKQLEETELREILNLRLSLSYLNQKAANLLQLLSGSAGYLNNTVASRKLREAHFISIVTPSVTQLEIMLDNL